MRYLARVDLGAWADDWGTPLPLRTRIIVALAAGLAGGALCYYSVLGRQDGLGDLAWTLRGAQLLLSGINPYHAPAGTYPNDYPLMYPLTALFLVLPFGLVPSSLSGGLFF